MSGLFSVARKGVTRGAKYLRKGAGRMKGVSPGKVGDFVQESLITGFPMREVKNTLRHPLQNPKKSLLLGAFGAGGAAFTWDQIIKPVVQAERPVTIQEAVEIDRKQRLEGKLQQIRFAEKRKRAMESLARLAALDPQLYNELSAGRRLPQGAMMFGGQPRTDLLESIAGDMAEGRFTEEPDPDDELASLFGGT